MTLKKRLLNWLLKTETVDIGVGGIKAMARIAKELQPGLTIRIQDPSGMVLSLNLLGQSGIGSVNVLGNPGNVINPEELRHALKAAIAETPCENPNCVIHGDTPLSMDQMIEDITRTTVPSIPASFSMSSESSKIAPRVAEEVRGIPLAMKAIEIASRHGWSLSEARPSMSTLKFQNGEVKLDVQWTDKGKYIVTHSAFPKIKRGNVSENLLEKILDTNGMV